MVKETTSKIIHANEVASYVVCPEAWNLKRQSPNNSPKKAIASKHETEVSRLKKEWINTQELSSQFRFYATIIYFLCVLVAITVFLLDNNRAVFGVFFVKSPIESSSIVSSSEKGQKKNSSSPIAKHSRKHNDPSKEDVNTDGVLSNRSDEGTPFSDKLEHNEQNPVPKTENPDPPKKRLQHLSKMLTVPNEIFLLLVLFGSAIFLWDFFDKRSYHLQNKGGLKALSQIETITLKGSKEVPSNKLVSEKLGLSSEPTAIIKKKGIYYPVVVKPVGQKVQDRHVIELLINLRLVEAAYNKKAPYGLLILGKDKREVRINNTNEKQRWLDTVLDEMHSIIDGVKAEPSPSFYKCKHCEVRSRCKHSAFKKKNRDCK